ncbi:MAG: triphosphoribosyl-dephospho-CoA synthase, partial [Burkholderiales bacterium]|nr:triphosphoribosyl-dephospho-CoA synthase [Burkholderiales bacterium]
APTVGLRAAMALAAGRDSIARQYADGFAAVIAAANELAPVDWGDAEAAQAAVQRVYLGFLGSIPDSHIVRKHGAALAHSVMSAAQAWRGVEWPGRDPRFAAWDESLKAGGLNPGTSADLTVAALFAAGLLAPDAAAWHGT